MTISQVLFSLDGRITRAPFVAVYIPVVIAAIILRIFVEVLSDRSVEQWWPAFIVAAILLVWINFAILIKRCHDRDKSGSWAMLSYIPLIGFLWAIIELGCFPGTRGHNRFGPDPRDAPPAPDAESVIKQPAKSRAGIVTLIVIVLVAGLVVYGIVNSNTRRQRAALDTTGLTPVDLSAYGDKLNPLDQEIATGAIKAATVTGIARATQAELDKRGMMLPSPEIGDLEFMATWLGRGKVARMTPIRIAIDNTTKHRVKGIVFELSDAGCEQNGAEAQGWIIDLAQPIEAETESYLDVSLPITPASGLWQNKMVCGIIRQAW